MEKHITDTSLDTFLAFGYSREFEKYRISSDLLLPLEGREAEPLYGNWFFTHDPTNRWDVSQTRGAAMTSFSPDAFACWEQTASMQSVCKGGTALFVREFSYAPQHSDEKVFLRFGGLDSRAVIFLNSTCIACNEGVPEPFSIDISSVVRDANTLFVAMDAAKSLSKGQPCSHTVSLVRTIPVGVKEWSLTLAPRYDYLALSLDIALSACCAKTMRLDIPELGIREELHLSNGHVHAIIKAHPEPWTEENPKLYATRLVWDDQILEETIGFRQG
jgi:beta-glucuronidase